MTQEQIVINFISGGAIDTPAGKNNLKIMGNKLVHYRTIIAERDEDVFIVNVTRYSLVTGRIQKMLKEKIAKEQMVRVHKVPEGTLDSLKPYVVG